MLLLQSNLQFVRKLLSLKAIKIMSKKLLLKVMKPHVILLKTQLKKYQKLWEFLHE